MQGVMVNIQDKLILWGRGRAMDAPENGYPHQTTFARFIRSSGQATVKLPPLAEDEFARVDVEVSKMNLKKPDHYKAICLYYIDRMGDAKIARSMKTTRHFIKNLRENAEHYLEAKLED